MLVGAEDRGQRRVDPGDVLAVGHDDQSAPAARDVAATACATSVGQSVPGAALHTARGDPPSARWPRKAGAGAWPAQAASAAAES